MPSESKTGATIAEANQPLTARQLFYRAVASSLIDKTRAAYNSTAVRLVGPMREEGRIPFDWISAHYVSRMRTLGNFDWRVSHSGHFPGDIMLVRFDGGLGLLMGLGG